MKNSVKHGQTVSREVPHLLQCIGKNIQIGYPTSGAPKEIIAKHLLGSFAFVFNKKWGHG